MPSLCCILKGCALSSLARNFLIVSGLSFCQSQCPDLDTVVLVHWHVTLDVIAI